MNENWKRMTEFPSEVKQKILERIHDVTIQDLQNLQDSASGEEHMRQNKKRPVFIPSRERSKEIDKQIEKTRKESKPSAVYQVQVVKLGVVQLIDLFVSRGLDMMVIEVGLHAALDYLRELKEKEDGNRDGVESDEQPG